MNFIPIITSVISFLFFALILIQFIKRRKIHQAVWTIAILFFGISTLMEFLMNPDVLGFNIVLFSLFYVTASSLVGFLGAGQLYLVFKNKLSHIFLVFVIVFTIGLIFTLVFTPFPSSITFVGELGTDIRAISEGYPISVRIWAIILASVGGVVLIIGSLYSFIRDRTRYYALFFTLGAVFPMLRNIPFGYLGNELASVISFFIGFLLSLYHLKKNP
ncbi:MAG: hypothetical protein EAX91_10770 [Candidatus Lokiarchaeota archaeon]|nr:hypothetical protein [Candidatus Lokiarchaeota archaeon]